jgi:ABC-type branched-subunit amino acid transport system permease subunit
MVLAIRVAQIFYWLDLRLRGNTLAMLTAALFFVLLVINTQTCSLGTNPRGIRLKHSAPDNDYRL